MTEFSKENEGVSAAHAALRTVVRDTRAKIKLHLDRLDPADPQVLHFAVEALVSKAAFDQKELAELIGVSRTTIGRWVQGMNIPRAPAFRKWVVQMLQSHLTEALDQPDDPEPIRLLPDHAATYTPTRLRK